jgi:hypothetical protein
MSEAGLQAAGESKVVSGDSARRAAKWFNYGTLVSLVLPFPLMIFWFGMSMLVYALNRHHPNPKVGHYTQHAAYRFYAIMGTLVVVGTFFPVDWRYYLGTWLLAIAILVPLSVRDLRRINNDDWQDVILPSTPSAEH